MAKPIVLITGAGIGIGRATAIAFANAGYHVVVTDVLDKEGAAVADGIKAARRQRRVPGASTSPTRRAPTRWSPTSRRGIGAHRRASSPMPASPTRCRSPR